MFARLLRLAPIGLLALSSSAFAQVFPTRAFDGEVLHDFSTNVVGQHKVVRTPLANFSSASILGFDVSPSFDSASCGAVASERGGTVLFTNDEYCVDYSEFLRVNFRDPVVRFGAYIMGGETQPLELTFRFQGANGQSLGEHHVTLPSGCDWHWVGYAIQGGLAAERLVIHNINQDPVVIDAITADLQPLPPVGSSFCDTRGANSTGSAASIAGFGSDLAADARLQLRADSVPQGAGIFFYGDTQSAAPFGNGMRCVSGSSGVVRLPAAASDNGVLVQDVDLAADPRMLAGSTWYFQLMYRDADAGGAGFDLSDGLELTLR